METLLNHLSQSLNGNPALAYLGVFVGGILSSSSPCVLATIPLVIGYVGGYSGGDRRKALLYSLTFILGLSITFTILGAIASFIGGYLAWSVAAARVMMKFSQPGGLIRGLKGMLGG